MQMVKGNAIAEHSFSKSYLDPGFHLTEDAQESKPPTIAGPHQLNPLIETTHSNMT